MKLKNSLFILVIMLGIGCDMTDKNEIEAELQPYFDLFQIEAEQRYITIDLSSIDISAYVEQIEDQGTLGQCKSFADGHKAVVVNEGYWNRASTLEKEYIVFHELGHCILNRGHDDTETINGTCKSIMQSGNGGCRSIYTDDSRLELINELFEFQ